MEYKRGVSQAQRVSRHHKNLDVLLNSVGFETGQESTAILQLQSEAGRCAQAGDGGGLSAVTGTIYVLTLGRAAKARKAMAKQVTSAATQHMLDMINQDIPNLILLPTHVCRRHWNGQ